MPVNTVCKYGIDFGTTNSSISLVMESGPNKGKIKVFDVDNYSAPYQLIRSVVAYKDGKKYVGDEGLEHVNGNEDNPVRQIKLRLLPEGEDALALKVNDRNLNISDIMADILRRLREKAEAQLHGFKPSGVVMGVPYQTSENAKAVYIKALVKAGFYTSYERATENTEFIEEPIAVAIYNGTKIAHQNKYALVFDYGGGTLDLAVVNLKAGNEKHKVIVKGGFQGAGEKFTKLLFLKAFFKIYKKTHCNNDAWELAKLFRKMGCYANNAEGIWHELEETGLGWKFINELDKVKIKLSTEQTATFSFYIPEDRDHEEISFLPIKITRDDFEEAIILELGTIREEINNLFKDDNCRKNGITKNKIDEVLLAGGSSMIPCIQQLLEKIFPGKVYFDKTVESSYYINVMTCIAQGLAISGFRKEEGRVDDITSFDYGYWNGFYKRIERVIPKGTPISDTDKVRIEPNMLPPESEYMVTVEQTDPTNPSFNVKVYEGETQIMKLCFNKKRHSGYYNMYYRINARTNTLEVHMYDNMEGKWIEDLDIIDRSYKIKK